MLIGEGALSEKIATYLDAAGRLAAHCGSDEIDAKAAARIGAADAPAIVFAPAGGPGAGVRVAAAMRAILAALRGTTRLLALGEGAFAVDDAGPLDPFQALTYGVVTAAALEEPMLIARYIDTDGAGSPGDLLAELAALERNPCAVAWRDGRRLVRRFEEIGGAGCRRRLADGGLLRRHRRNRRPVADDGGNACRRRTRGAGVAVARRRAPRRRFRGRGAA